MAILFQGFILRKHLGHIVIGITQSASLIGEVVCPDLTSSIPQKNKSVTLVVFSQPLKVSRGNSIQSVEIGNGLTGQSGR